jgi:methionyl-tRNA formyltransferase
MTKKGLNFIFWGTPEAASETLETLKRAGYLPSLIITAPDRPKGRKMIITPPPVKVWAVKNKIPYIQPENFSEKGPSFGASLRTVLGENGEKNFDLAIVVAYGKILPEEILDLPKFGFINIHYSLLPKYRGASPVETAILNGDTETGISIQKMVFKMDAGPILAQEKVIIGPEETAPELRKRLTKIGGELLVKFLETLSVLSDTSPSLRKRLGGGKFIEQNETQATYCKKIKKEDGLVDLATEPPSELYNKFRAYAEWPRTYFFTKSLDAFVNGPAERSEKNRGPEQKHQVQRIIITEAKLEDGKFVIKKIIPEGKKEIEIEYKD